MILSGQSIRKRGIFTPFHERSKAHGMTFGVGPAGYDVRIDKKVVLRPGDFALAATMERFDIPTDLIAIIHDKSTWARKGLALQNTVAEPGWCGYLTIELSNHGPDILTIEAGSPIAQVLLHVLDQATETPYAGKYQDQKSGAQPALMEV